MPDLQRGARTHPGRRRAHLHVAAAGAAALATAIAGHCVFVLTAAGPTDRSSAGTLVQVAPLTVDLRDGHYAEVALVLRFAPADSATDEPSVPSVDTALDVAIAELSRRSSTQLLQRRTRTELAAKIVRAYGKRVSDVSFDDFRVN